LCIFQEPQAHEDDLFSYSCPSAQTLFPNNPTFAKTIRDSYKYLTGVGKAQQASPVGWVTCYSLIIEQHVQEKGPNSSFSSTPLCFWSPVDGGGARPTSVCACSCSSADLPGPCHHFFNGSRAFTASLGEFNSFAVTEVPADSDEEVDRFCSADLPAFSRWGLVTTLTTPGKRTHTSYHIIISHYSRAKSWSH